jgi:transposase
MRKTDARSFNDDTKQHIRDQIIRLRKEGKKNKDIAIFFGISKQHASTIWQKYRKGGKSAVVLGLRGRRHGEKRTLNKDQEKEIKNLIIDKTPDQLKFPFALWTRQAIKELVWRRYRTDMPIRTIGEYLSRWGFTPKKPVKQAREQKPEAVEQWLKTEYPLIARQAKKEKAEIFWGDETGIQNEANHTRGYAPQGTKPVLRIPSKKERINMLSAVNNEGKVRFMIFRESMSSSRLIDFMKRLIRDTKRKIYLILDNLKAHHSKAVTQWLEKKKDSIRAFYLPPYSPELNPDEYLNNDLKQRVHSGVQSVNAKDLKHKTESFMRRLIKRPHHVKKCFDHTAVKYAA